MRELANYDRSSWYSLDKAESSQPFLYSYAKPNSNNKGIGNISSLLGKPRTILQIDNSSLSKSEINLEVIQQGELEILDRENKNSYQLGVSVEVGPEHYRRTKIVTIAPRYLLVNKMGRKLWFQQVGVDKR